MCLVWLIKKSLNKVLNKDIYESLQQIDILKAIGPYGFLAVFFQWYWHIVRDNVNEVVKSFSGMKVFLWFLIIHMLLFS